MVTAKLKEKKIAEMVIRPSSEVHTGYLLREMTGNLILSIAAPSGLYVSFNFLCKSICWPVPNGKLGHFPTCAGTQKPTCWELCFRH